MTGSDPKADLRRYLQEEREALLWKLEGLSEYDIRRPMVPTGTNLLGLVKHVAFVEFGYFGDTFGRPSEDVLQWDESDPNSDMFASHVPWGPAERNEVTLHRILVHVATETARHAGQADIIRELIDGAAGLTSNHSNLPSGDQAWWAAYRDRVERAAQEAARASSG